MPKARLTARASARAKPRVIELLLSKGDDVGAYPLEKVLLTPRQLAKALEVSTRRVKYWTAMRVLPSVKLGGSNRYIAADIIALLTGLTTRATDERGSLS